MNKTDFVAAVAEKAGFTKKDADKAVSAFIGSITAALKNGEKVSLIGFGTFEAKKRAARKGKNPQTGAEMNIPATTVPAFKAGKALKAAIK